MTERGTELFYFKDHLNQDGALHDAIIADGDDAAARAVSDKVAREIGLTDAQIAALRAPDPVQQKAALKKRWQDIKAKAEQTLARLTGKPPGEN
jgi:2-hydroxychromene-2-carboxylate isomerase